MVCWDLRKPMQTLACLRVADGPIFAVDCTRSTGEPISATAGVQNKPEPLETGSVQIFCGGASSHVFGLRLGVAHGQMDCAMKVQMPEEGVGDISMRPDNRIVATGCWDSCVRIFHVRTGKSLAVLQQHRASIAAVEFSASGLLACASRDKTISLWDVELAQKQ